ncbi:MAG: hypothetical protein JXD23_12080 [Spirochaetales bacterium]|nr:hypothetical protein [Spirochaetales bacterium]
MDQERLKILKMVEEKKLSADDAAKLIDALDGTRSSREAARSSAGRPVSDRPGRLLRLKVSDQESGRARVNLSIPVGIAHVIKSLVPPQEMEKLERQGFNLNAILDAIDGNTVGKVFEAEDDDRRVHIEISIE